MSDAGRETECQFSLLWSRMLRICEERRGGARSAGVDGLRGDGQE
jgi:hypothetical protein